jgi:hypothetical protein
LRKEYLAVTIETECSHCNRALRLVVDSDLEFRVETEGAEPMVFEPQVDWSTFTEPSIIHAY